MNRRIPLPIRLLATLLEALELAARFLRRRIHEFRIGLLTEALSDEERHLVSIDAYHDSLEPEKADHGLHDWEETWFAAELPPAPATLLLAAAGSGREAVALETLGYTVDVLEPASRPVRTCRQRLPETSRVVQADFTQLAASVLEARHSPASNLATGYDAVILGWGGLTHVLNLPDRLRLIQACHLLTPAGPILASFFMDPHAVSRQQATPAVAAGCFLGRLIARARGLPAIREPVEFTTWGGFLRHFTPSEIDELADASGRNVQWQREGGFPHVTFLVR